MGDFGGVAKKCDRFTFILAGFKNFSGWLKSCQKVEQVRSENSPGLGSAGVLLRGVPVDLLLYPFDLCFAEIKL